MRKYKSLVTTPKHIYWWRDFSEWETYTEEYINYHLTIMQKISYNTAEWFQEVDKKLINI